MKQTTLTRMMLAIVPVVVLFLGGLMAFVSNMLFTQGVESAKTVALNYANQASRTIRVNLRGVENMLRLTAQSLSEIDPESEHAAQSADEILLSMLKLSDNTYCAWFIFEKGVYYEDERYIRDYINNDGKIAEMHDFGGDAMLSGTEQAQWYFSPLNTGEPYFGKIGLYAYDAANQPINTSMVSMPIIRGGEVIGVCGIDVTYRGIFDVADYLKEQENRKTILISNDMTILYSHDHSLINHNLSELGFSDIDTIQTALEAEQPYTGEDISPISGKKSLIYLIPINASTSYKPMYLYVGMPLEYLYADAYDTLKVMAVAGLGMLALIVIIIVINVRMLLKPIKRMTRDALSVAGGDPDTTYEIHAKDGKNEIAILEDALANMVGALWDNIETVEGKVRDQTHELTLATQEAEDAKKRAVAAAEAKTQFLANMSHELRTPLNAVIGTSELLSMEDLTECGREYVTNMHTSSRVLLKLIDNLLDTSDINPVNGETPAVNYNFTELVDEVNAEREKIRSEAPDMFSAPDARVLAVDDNPVNLNVIGGLFQIWGIHNDEACSGAEAVDLIRKNKYDLVFMDLMMPELDGIETTGMIRALGEEYAKLPIVGLTANAVQGTRERMLEAGINDFLTKPVEKDLLHVVLKRWIPEELQLAYMGYIPDTDQNKNADFWDALSKIDELDCELGLTRISGQRDVYEDSLTLMVKELPACREKLSSSLKEGDARSFDITVHGIKGSLANIGAMALSEAAYALEKAAKQSDLDFCAAHLGAFSEGLERLEAALLKAFENIKDENPVCSPQEAADVLQRLKTALLETDFQGIDDASRAFEAFRFGGASGRYSDKLKYHVLTMEYEEAAAVIDKMLSDM